MNNPRIEPLQDKVMAQNDRTPGSGSKGLPEKNIGLGVESACETPAARPVCSMTFGPCSYQSPRRLRLLETLAVDLLSEERPTNS